MGKVKDKRILDSVHGYITISADLCEHIIDTEYFQRLRRIEQTSTRSLFPSARHDRFIHSLGVFHLGTKIVEHLSSLYTTEKLGFDVDTIYASYKVSCLLHDVGHSPFSHTFEKYFDNNKSDLKKILKQSVHSDAFSTDWMNQSDRSAPHERMSAIVALEVYRDFLVNIMHADIELVARMIIGLYYGNKSTENTFKNAMIDLIHGDVIDADGLDYVCRDAWASGYSTTKVDVVRLIDSIRIEQNRNHEYTLCFTSKSLNEIESVLKVKTFQQYYVINHHTVTYEQKLLVEAMKSAAWHLIGYDESFFDKTEEEQRENAIRNLCSIYSFVQPGNKYEIGVWTRNRKQIKLPMDDDFISLMKDVRDDKYVSQWLSRKFLLQPLWKSKAEFYALFEGLVDTKLTQDSWIFHDDCRTFISQKFNIAIADVWIEKATPKYKGNFARKVSLFVNDKVEMYESLFPKDIQSFEPIKNEFFYIYIPKSLDKDTVIKELQKEYVKYFSERVSS